MIQTMRMHIHCARAPMRGTGTCVACARVQLRVYVHTWCILGSCNEKQRNNGRKKEKEKKKERRRKHILVVCRCVPSKCLHITACSARLCVYVYRMTYMMFVSLFLCLFWFFTLFLFHVLMPGNVLKLVVV